MFSKKEPPDNTQQENKKRTTPPTTDTDRDRELKRIEDFSFFSLRSLSKFSLSYSYTPLLLIFFMGQLLSTFANFFEKTRV